MQENEFEKSIREKMERLEFEPAEDVWKKVSDKIAEDKKRRRLLFFLLPITLLLGSAGLYLLIKPTTPTGTVVAKNNIPAIGETTHKEHPISTKPYGGSGMANVPEEQKENEPEKQIERQTRQKVAIDNSEKHPQKEFTKEVTSGKQTPLTLAGKDEKVLVLKVTKNSQLDNKTKDEKSRQVNNNLPLLNSANPSPDATNNRNNSANKADHYSDTVNRFNPNNKAPDATKDLAKLVVAETKLKPKVAPARKLKFGFTVFSGISNNQRGFSSSDKSTFSYANANPSSSNAGQASFPVSKLTYSSGFSYGFGIFLKRSFSKRIDLSAGINYHFLSATSPVGTMVTSNRTIYDASLQSNFTVNQFYASGQTSNYRNKYKTIELPLNIFFQVNKNQNKKLLLTAGITPAYLVGATSLYANNSQNVYYETSEQFKKMIWSLQGGIQYSVLSARRFNIIVGPEFQYGINNMAKAATGTNQHLTSASLKVGVSL